MLGGDVVAQVPGLGQVARVAGHAGEAAGVHLGAQGGHLGVGRGSGADEQQDRRDPGGYLCGQLSPASDDLAGIGLLCLQLIGPRFGRDGSLAGQRRGADRAYQAGLAAEGLVDRLDRDLRLRRDRGDRRRREAVAQKQLPGNLDHRSAGLLRLLGPAGGVIAALRFDRSHIPFHSEVSIT